MRIISCFSMSSRASIPQTFQFEDTPECPWRARWFPLCDDTQRSSPTETARIMGECPRGIWQRACSLLESTPTAESQLGPGPRRAILPIGPQAGSVRLLVGWLADCFVPELYFFFNWVWRWGLTWPPPDIYMTCLSLKTFEFATSLCHYLDSKF